MKNFTLPLIFFLSGTTASFAQGFYDINTIQSVKINFFQNNWDHLLDSLKSLPDETYLIAQSVEINGQTFDSVGVKYKGYSSYEPDNLKNPLHIELDHVRKGQNYQGVKDVKLANGYSDPTFVRETMSYEILRKYMAAPLANYAEVWMNGEYWGLYTNVESINKKFARKHFHTDGDNPFFKCNPVDVVASNGHSDLVYESADSVDYFLRYKLLSDEGWAQLLALMDTVTNFPWKIDHVIDVDRALWMLAFNNVLVNLDSYTGAFAQNYYIYRDKNDRWLPVVWDLNMSFGSFPLLDGGDLLSIPEMKQLDPLAKADNDFRPLIKNLIDNPTFPAFRRMYLAHMRTILKENFSSTAYKTRALQLQALIDASVQADDHKFYSYDNFLKNIDQTVSASGGFGDAPGLTDLMNNRYNYLINNPNLSPAPPVISNITEMQDDEIHIVAKVQNATDVTLAFRYDSADIFQKLPMFDDGAHDDGPAGDGVYGQEFPYGGLSAQYYIYAENANAGAFSPQRAEYEFYTATLTPPLPNVGDIVINEFLAGNMNAETDEAGQHEDWLELYNNDDIALGLSGMYLTDDPAKPDKWLFPQGTHIPSKGFLIVWLDEDQSQGPLHANFKLKVDGEFIMLSNGAGGVIDSLTFGQQVADKSFGRFPNGTGVFTSMPRTFNAVNSLVSGANEPGTETSFRIFPNPVTGILMVESDFPPGLIRVFDMFGRQILATEATDSGITRLDLTGFPPGIYCLKIGDRAVKSVCVQPFQR